MAGVLLLDICVTQHPPHSLSRHKVPQSPQNLSSWPGLGETEQCHPSVDMSVCSVSLSGHLRAGGSIPSSALQCRGHPAALSPSDEYLRGSCRSFPAGWMRRDGSGGEEGNHE